MTPPNYTTEDFKEWGAQGSKARKHRKLSKSAAKKIARINRNPNIFESSAGNWFGRIGRKVVAEFSGQFQERDARAWLKDQLNSPRQ